MLILHLLSTSKFSGAENVVCQIIDMYKNSDIRMFYCSPNGDIKDTLKKKKIDFIGLDKLDYKEVNNLVNKYHPDIIHAHDIKASIVASLFYKKCRIISHIHGNSESMKKISLKSVLFFLASKRIKHIFWVSKSSMDEYKFSKLVMDKSTVLQNVISIDDVLDKANRGTSKNSDVLFVGRLTEIKNPLRLVKIFSEVTKKVSNAKMVVVGDGNLFNDMRKAVEKEKLKKNINLVGFQSNPYVYMKNSKILIMTSIYEGIPMCALEAMALGLPVVSTPTDGLVDIIDQNRNGFLSSSDDELSKKIVELIKNKEKYNSMSSNAKMKAKEINNLEKYKKELNKYYF